MADDHTIIRDGLKLMLKDAAPEVTVVGEASSGGQLIKMLEETEADVVLLDIFMPDTDGIQAARHLSKHFPQVKIIMLTMINKEKHIREALQAGAFGYLLKTADQAELLQAIRSVADGKKYLSSQIAIDLLTNKESKLPFTENSLHKNPLLSKREIEVLKLISQGYTNAEIAQILSISKRTIEIHRQNMLEKTHTRNTANLISYAFSNRLLHILATDDITQSGIAR